MKLSENTMIAGIATEIARMATQLAERVEKTEPPEEQPAFAFAAPSGSRHRMTRALRPPLPDPRLVRRIVRLRQMRARFFEGDLFADPAWDMLLDLAAARVEHRRVGVTSLCIASGVPPTTALRWISIMVEAGLFERVADDIDKRRSYVSLSDRGADAVARYFAALGEGAALPI